MYSSGGGNQKNALGICDRCGFTYKLNELTSETWNKSRKNNRVCPECFDPDHPQLRVGADTRVGDPYPLKQPRPDTGKVDSTSLFGWKPVGHEETFVTVSVGTVRVTT